MSAESVRQTDVMQIRRATESDRPLLAALAERLQPRADRHIAYLGVDAATIAEEMIDEDDDWTAAASVAEADGKLVGWLMGSVDPDMGRVWWFGPFVDADADGWPAVADALYEHASGLLHDDVDEEELAPDARFATLIEWATGRGFDIDPGSAVLRLSGDMTPAAGFDPAISIRHAAEPDAPALAALHDELFPGTHTTGETLATDADERHIRLVALYDGAFAGYVAAELQADETGYIDYLGTTPEFRRRGIAAALIRAAVLALSGLGAGDMHLTVREANHGARALYTGLGFDEERVITPVRRGFRLL